MQKQASIANNNAFFSVYYSTFGMLMPGRNETADDGYRYGFQGQEMDDEIKGKGNSVNYTFRMHDPRVGRFLSLDPLSDNYPHNSPYVFSENRVIDGVELEGLEYYFAASGAYLGRISGSTEVRIVNADRIEAKGGLENYSAAIKAIQSGLNSGYEPSKGHYAYLNNVASHPITSDESKLISIELFDDSKHHVFTWGDPTLTGNNVFGKPKCTNCADLADAQAEELGTQIKGGVVNTNSIIGVLDAETNLLEDMDGEAINYIHKQLEAGNAIVVGVDDGASGGTDSRGTDHYVTIVGRGIENGESFFFFIEDATNSASKATNFEVNRLFPQEDGSSMNGSSTWGGNGTFNVTRVQENVDK